MFVDEPISLFTSVSKFYFLLSFLTLLLIDIRQSQGFQVVFYGLLLIFKCFCLSSDLVF